jgi:hypothetical protein
MWVYPCETVKFVRVQTEHLTDSNQWKVTDAVTHVCFNEGIYTVLYTVSYTVFAKLTRT